MASKYWIKMYHEALHDPKLASLANNLWRRFWELCLIAGELDEEGFLPPVEAMAWTVRTGEDALRSELGQLAMRGLVELAEDDNGTERWFVSNFAKRQAPSSNAKRMREYRKRKRAEKENTPHTPQKKEREEETDTDTYRTVTPVTVALQNVTHTHEVAGPNAEIYTDMLAAVSGVVKTIRTEHVNGAQFDDVVYTLIGYDITPSQVRGFGDWWKDNGWYSGKPALKTMIDEIQNYLASGGKQPAGAYEEIDYGSL